MQRGDRLKVIDPDSEFFGIAGVMLGVTREGRVVVILDNCHLHVDFDPHALELEELVS